MALNSLVVKCKKIFFLNKKCVHNFKLPAVFIIKQILVGNKKHKYNFCLKIRKSSLRLDKGHS